MRGRARADLSHVTNSRYAVGDNGEAISAFPEKAVKGAKQPPDADTRGANAEAMRSKTPPLQ
jgi:hypothetical protein